MGDAVEDPVECYSGSQYAEKPRALYWEGQRLAILQVESEWRTPNNRCFRVLTEDQRRFELFYGEFDDEWRIQPI